jgi:hypothetical protein
VTRAGRLFRNLLERFLGRYYEGPTPPPRLGEEVALWFALNPDADHARVRGYVTALLDAAYRDGFVRGYEWQERGWEGPAIDPEQLAEAAEHDWSLADWHPRARRILTDGMDAADPLANVAAPDRRRFHEALLAAQDVTVVPGDD